MCWHVQCQVVRLAQLITCLGSLVISSTVQLRSGVAGKPATGRTRDRCMCFCGGVLRQHTCNHFCGFLFTCLGCLLDRFALTDLKQSTVRVLLDTRQFNHLGLSIRDPVICHQLDCKRLLGL